MVTGLGLNPCEREGLRKPQTWATAAHGLGQVEREALALLVLRLISQESRWTQCQMLAAAKAYLHESIVFAP